MSDIDRLQAWRRATAAPDRSPAAPDSSALMRAATRLAGMAKPIPIEPPLRREDRGVDADQPAVQVDQGAAGIARIDGRIGLDEGHVALRSPAVRARAPRRCRWSPSGRCRTGCRSRARGRPPRGRRNRPSCSAGSVSRLVDVAGRPGRRARRATGSAPGTAPVGQHDRDLVGALDHVVVGHDEPVAADDHAGAERVLYLALRRGMRRRAARRRTGRTDRRGTGRADRVTARRL